MEVDVIFHPTLETLLNAIKKQVVLQQKTMGNGFTGKAEVSASRMCGIKMTIYFYGI